MGKPGLGIASFFLTASVVGLGFSSYYVANVNKFQNIFEEAYSSPEVEVAFAYGKTAENLEEAATNMGNYIVTEKDVLIIQNPDKDEALEYLDDAISEISNTENQDQYINQIVDIHKNFLSLDVKYKENAAVLQELKNKTKQLSNNLENLAMEKEPNYFGINSRIDGYENNAAGCNVGIFFASLGIIGFGIWTLRETLEVLENSGYTKRKRNKP